jgi:hypothetical protein
MLRKIINQKIIMEPKKAEKSDIPAANNADL